MLTKKTLLLYLTVFFIFFIPRVIGLGSDIANIDSILWHGRSADFVEYILKGQFRMTELTYHPGITLLWIVSPFRYAFIELFKFIYDYDPTFIPQQFIKIHLISKLPLVFIISLLGVYTFHMLKNITDKKYAIIFAAVLSLEPFFLGISRFLHVTALTTMFSFISFLSILRYKKDSLKYLIISSVSMGFAVLTKIDGIIILPINLLVVFIYYVKLGNFRINSLIFLKLIFSYIIILFSTFILFYPAAWYDPIGIIKNIIESGIEDTAFSDAGAPTLTGYKGTYYIETLFFRTLPSSFILFLFGLFKLLKKSGLKDFFNLYLWPLLSLLIIILVLSIPTKLKDRYLITIIPYYLMITAYTIRKLLDTKLQKALIISLCAIYLVTLVRYHPVYSFYYTDLTGGPEGYDKLGLPIVNRGEYYAQVAHYININDTNSGEKNLSLNKVSLVPSIGQFFYGKTFSSQKDMPDGYELQYYVLNISKHQSIDSSKCKLNKQFGPRFGYKTLELYECTNVTNDDVSLVK